MRNIRSRVVVVSALAAATALCPAITASATPDATPSAAADADGAAIQRVDDRPDSQDAERRAGIEDAVAKVVRGEATPVTKGGGKAVQVSPGQWAQYGLQSTDSILTFLVDFGDQKDSRYPTAPTGPVHNNIPEPDRTKDNSTYWVDNFNRDHFQNMFFGGGESMSSVYSEMSSGRYTVTGDTSDWVT